MSEEQELSKEYLQADINSKKKEVINYEKSIQEHEEVLKLMTSVSELFGQAIEKYTTPEMVRKLEPVFRFEKEDGYWELQSRLMMLEQKRKHNLMVDVDIPRLKEVINKKREGLEELKTLIKKMEGERE